MANLVHKLHPKKVNTPLISRAQKGYNYQMDYSLLNYAEILKEIDGIKKTNLDTLDRHAVLIEENHEPIKNTPVEYFPKMFDGYRSFFNTAEKFFDEAQVELKNENVTLGLVERINSFGEKAYYQLLEFKPRVDKVELNRVSEFREVLNEWYTLIAENLAVLSELQSIANALNSNFRHIRPISDIKVNDIAVQSADNGITITKSNDIYIDGKAVKLEGQRQKIMMLLVKNYIELPDIPVSWMAIEEEIRVDDNNIEKNKVVDRVSSLRTRLKEQGFDKSVIEIINTTEGVEASWRLIKHSVG